MDDYGRKQSGMATPSGTHSQPLTPHSAMHTPQFHQSHGASQTLPPLHATSQYPPMYGHSGSAPQTPITSQLPSTSAPSSNLSSAAPHPSLRPLQPSYYSSSLPFPSSQPGIMPAGPAHVNPQPIAPATMGGAMQELRPMPQGGLALPQQYGQSQLYQQPPTLPNQEPEPLHVVGQQGRRGVLPTLTGRPAPAAGKSPANPTKNSENKFECPHCTKTYLHLKHLKRHLLRHTGERPYQCHLCKDTFSRSDILKRHFQKCSIRRGNPTGANHLAHSQSHLRKNRAPTGNTTESNLMPIATSTPYSDTTPFVSPLPGGTIAPEQSQYADNVASLSARSSRSNSVIRHTGTAADQRRSMSALDFQNNQKSGFDAAQPTFRTPTTMPGSIGSGIQAYNQHSSQAPPMQNNYGYAAASTQADMHGNLVAKSEGPAPMYNRESLSNIEGLSNGQESNPWQTSFNSAAQDGYRFPPVMGSGHASVNTESNATGNHYHSSENSHDNIFSSPYSNAFNRRANAPTLESRC